MVTCLAWAMVVADGLGGGHHGFAVIASGAAPGASRAGCCREAIGQNRLQPVADFQAAAPVADGQQQQDAFVLALLPHAPGAKNGVGDILDGLAFQSDGMVTSAICAPVDAFDGGAVGFQLAWLAGSMTPAKSLT